MLRPSRSPFSTVLPGVGLAVGHLVAAIAWVVLGEWLPGGRWLAVHLFTLGVLSNAVLAMSQHFGVTLTRSPDQPHAAIVPVFNLGAVAVLVGVASTTRWLTGVGATLATAAVLWAYASLRRWRKQAVGARFTWIVRLYERAHGAFVHGAVLGLLMGVGVLGGPWYGTARLAHLHVNVLGWGGVTLLATLVFFGPTVVRRRIEDDADTRAARALRRGTTGLTAATLLLLASGIGGVTGAWLRVAAAGGLAVLAWAGTVTCAAVLRAALHSSASARWGVIGVVTWLPLALWADVVVVAAGRWRYLDALGVTALVGVLLQAILITLMHLAPTFVAAGATRDVVRRSLERLGGLRTLVLNLGVGAAVAAVAAGRALGATGSLAVRGGAALVVLAVAQPALAFVLASWRDDRDEGPTPSGGPGRSAVA